MRKQPRRSLQTSTKVALLKLKAAFLTSVLAAFSAVFIVVSLPSCAPADYPNTAVISHRKVATKPQLLTTKQTHEALKHWAESNYQSTADHKYTIKSFDSSIDAASLTNNPTIISGYSISRFTERTEGIGLPALVKLKSKANRIISPITSDAFVLNLRPINIIATESVENGIATTNFEVYQPYKNTYNGQVLKRQPNIVMDYIEKLPGNSGLKLKGLIRPSNYVQYRGLYLAEPYDKKRIPILMIHGLASSPETWAKMADAINADPKLREKYQLWYYFYPTGTPWLVTASKFRTSFRGLIKALDPDGNDANLRKTTIICHSMGGLITRLSLSEPGNKIQDEYFGNTPLNKVLKPEDVKKVNNYFHFKPLTEPSRVIFLATPHRGSRIAEGFIGSIVIRLISIPTYIIQQTADVLTTGQLIGDSVPEQTRKLLTKGESSINQLQPSNPSLKALDKMPIRKDIDSYSIIGDIGIPLVKLRTDGVVSHTSSNITYNKSQVIIPSGHNICGQPKAIEAVIKILSN